MKFFTISIAVSLLSAIAACGGPDDQATVPTAQPEGESSITIGSHEIHYSAQLTDQLPPEVARAYNIVRSKNRAMLNVSVIESATGTSVPASVAVETVNLTGQMKNVIMRKIQEQEAIYYIGETPVANQETLIFDISVTPEGATEASEVRFKRQFFTD
jgi:Domain of unknown function (DUF4426)